MLIGGLMTHDSRGAAAEIDAIASASSAVSAMVRADTGNATIKHVAQRQSTKSEERRAKGQKQPRRKNTRGSRASLFALRPSYFAFKRSAARIICSPPRRRRRVQIVR